MTILKQSALADIGRGLHQSSHTFEVPGKCKCQRDPLPIHLALHIPPRGHENNGLRGISPRGLKNGVYILPSVHGT